MQQLHMCRAPGSRSRKPRSQTGGAVVGFVSLAVIIGVLTASQVTAVTLAAPSRSTSIALTSDDRRVVVVNRDANTVSIIEVRDENNLDVANKLAEVSVGQEPRYVALSPNDGEAYVTNSVSGTVSVINLSTFSVVAEIPVGTEPRGCVVTPNGRQLLVANHTSGSVSVIRVATRTVINTITTGVGANPTALAITNDGDTDDNDETVFVSDFYAKLIPNGPGEGFDTGKQGVIYAFSVSDAISSPTQTTRINLAPLSDSGFDADRSKFCPQSFVPPPPPLPQTLHSDIFCPVGAGVPPGSPAITAAPQAVFPNQLQSLLIRNVFLYAPGIGAQPEPPVRFNVNVQGLINVVNTGTLSDIQARKVNLNEQVTVERNAGNTQGIEGLHLNDIVAMDANLETSPLFLIVSRGGDYVIEAVPSFVDGRLDIGAPNNVTRYRTGLIPNGVVASSDGRRAYTNNEVGHSVTAINLRGKRVITRDIPSAEPPEPGTFAHSVLLGKFSFHTALGLPDNGIFDTPIRAINSLQSVGKASDSAWSSCASCHPDGLADGVTWIFADGPRQTLPLDASVSKKNPVDQRIFNWSAVRGSNTDFNNNSRAVQGGCGFASDDFSPTPCPSAGGNTIPQNPGIYDHGLAQGASDVLDALSTWVQTVRAPILPLLGPAAKRARGLDIFAANCASCHGGAKWTKSQVIYADNPAFFANPAAGGTPRDPGVVNAGAQIVRYTVDPPGAPGPFVLRFLNNVGTFTDANPLEIRGAGAAIGTTALGDLGLNAPSVLGIRYHAPYFHNGSAQNLSQVFAQHNLPPSGTITTQLSASERSDLTAFLQSIDGSTNTLPSATDAFKDDIAP